MQTDQERIATLEANRKADKEQAEDLECKVDRIDRNVQDIQRKLSKQGGFVAGIVLVLGGIWSVVATVLVTGWDKIVAFFTGS